MCVCLKMQWESLPPAVVRRMLHYMEPSDWSRLRLVCKTMCQLVDVHSGPRLVHRDRHHLEDHEDGGEDWSDRARDINFDWEQGGVLALSRRRWWGKKWVWMLFVLVFLALVDVMLGIVGLANFGRGYFDTLFVWVNGTRVGEVPWVANVTGAIVAPRCPEPTLFAWTTCMCSFLICCGVFALLYIVVVFQPRLPNFDRWRVFTLSLLFGVSCPALIIACVVVKLSSDCDATGLWALSATCVVLGLMFWVGFGVAVTLMEFYKAHEEQVGVLPAQRDDDRVANVYITSGTQDMTDAIASVSDPSIFVAVDFDDASM